MKKASFWLILMVWLLSVGNVVWAQDTPPDSEVAYVRVWNLSLESNPLDIWWNGEIIGERLRPSEWVDYLSVTAGTGDIVTVNAGEDIESTENRFNKTITLEPNRWYNLILTGTFDPDSYDVFVAEEDRTAIPDNVSSRIYIFNGLNTASVIYTLNEIEDTLPAGQFWGADLPNGQYDLGLLSGDPLPADISLGDDFEIRPNGIYFVGITAVEDTPKAVWAEQRLATMEIKPLAVNTPPVDIYIDNTPLLLNVAYQTRNQQVRFLGGTYHLKITPQNEPETILYEQESVEFEADTFYTLWLTGEFDTPSFKAELRTDDPTALAEFTEQLGTTYSYVRLHHLAPDVPSIDIRLTDGTVMLENIPYGEDGYLQVLAGEYDLLLTLSGEPETLLFDLTEVELQAGVVYDLYVIGLLQDIQAGTQMLYTELTCVVEIGCD